MKLDFSRFHPIDHWPGTNGCRQMPGGIKLHLIYAWDIRWKDQVYKPFRRIFKCTRNKHTWMALFSANKIEPFCIACKATRLPSEFEIDKMKEMPFL